MKNPFFFTLVILTILGNIADVITTQFIIAGEANPLYHLTGTMVYVYLLKAAVCIYIFYRWYRGTWSSIYEYHMMISILMITTTLLWIAACWNLYGAFHYTLVAEASMTPPSARVSQYFSLVIILYLIPFFTSLFTFIATERTKHNVYIYTKEERKVVKWWKRL